MDKLRMMSMDNVQMNVEKIQKLFPNAVTEVLRDGKPTLAIDFDVLKQELSAELIDDKEERYQMTWPDKKKSIRLANTPISATLRPCKEESVDFDHTQNLYIEGDNLDVLKLLQETYLGKVDVIYIDPPYNTGSDFIYNDDFSQPEEAYAKISGQYDNQGNKLYFNSLDNGRFHTDWLNMIYPRLKLAKDLLCENGIIFISIDDNEVYNMKRICDEIFGEYNFIANFIRKTSCGEKTAKPNINKHHDYVLCYSKQIQNIQENDILNGELKKFENYSNPDNDPRGDWTKDSLLIKIDNGRYGYARYPITNPYLNITHYPPVVLNENDRKQWHYIESTFREMEKRGEVVYYKSKTEYLGEYSFFIKKYRSSISKIYNNISTLFATENEYTNANGTNDIVEVFKKKEFENSYPKPVFLIKKLIQYSTMQNKNAVILDFFSGSGTTAQSVMELNNEDNGNRHFILVQLPEECGEKSSYKTICDIGKERIRRAGKKILQESGVKRVESGERRVVSEVGDNSTLHTSNSTLDVGFRVLKLDSSNMKDVYYKPSDYSQGFLGQLEDNIKADRTPLDLLFQVMLDLGKPLSAKIEEREIAGKRVFVVDDNDLVACFDSNITEDVVKTIAQLKPLYAVFRDSGLSSDSVGANFDQIFATYSPNTTRKVL